MERDEVISNLWDLGARYIEIAVENNDIPKFYGEIALSYTERRLLVIIGDVPGITITEMAAAIRKTPSICSQIIKKFVNYGWVEQIRNEKNKRIYNLQLTEEGKKAYQVYVGYSEKEKAEIITVLKKFRTEELEIYTKIQEAMNEVCNLINEGYRLGRE